jgi:AraC-like DNA-binding protein
MQMETNTIEIAPASLGLTRERLTFGSEPGPDAASRASCERAELTISYMKAHLNQPLQVPKLAAMVNVSPSHFFALFKRHTGFSPIDFFIRLRMSRARELLDHTAASVKEVAAALGYDDPFYFSRVFKAVYHQAPTLYRQRSRDERGVATNAPPGAPARVGSVFPRADLSPLSPKHQQQATLPTNHEDTASHPVGCRDHSLVRGPSRGRSIS